MGNFIWFWKYKGNSISQFRLDYTREKKSPLKTSQIVVFGNNKNALTLGVSMTQEPITDRVSVRSIPKKKQHVPFTPCRFPFSVCFGDDVQAHL